MVPEVPAGNTTEADHIVRRSLALLRMCFYDIPNGYDLLDQRLQQSVGPDWKEKYEKRNNEKIGYGGLNFDA